ncbi:hypothetical protein M067_0672 [Bacteroides fragilis str. J-143-4]|nr:hypothetical protein M067_0672 [Bacteroides fragilis str. J-143-4]
MLKKNKRKQIELDFLNIIIDFSLTNNFSAKKVTKQDH